MDMGKQIPWASEVFFFCFMIGHYYYYFMIKQDRLLGCTA